MDISEMKELDQYTIDKFGRINCACSNPKGEVGDIGCCGSVHDFIENYLALNRLLREAETIYKEEAKKEKKAMEMPSTIGVVQRKNTTVVNWDDGVKTVVTLKEDDSPDPMFVGFCIAYTKRMLGGTTKLLETIDRCDTDRQKQRMKETAKKFRKQRDLDRKGADRIYREKKFNEMVEEELMRMRAAEEAKARYSDYIHEHEKSKEEE